MQKFINKGAEFEDQIAGVLDHLIPNSYLANVPVFRADATMLPDAMANELDFIAHLRKGRTHTILVIECKACPITGASDGRGNYEGLTAGGPWLAHYKNDIVKKVKDQLKGQRAALLTNLEPLDGEVSIHSVVVTAKPEGLPAKTQFISSDVLPTFQMSLVRAESFIDYLKHTLSLHEPLRVQQSEILRRLRLGQAVTSLGHPELYNAIEYTRRCRAFIDSEIFRHLELKRKRWAINGSAGMGKSVLLMYAVMVLITDRIIDTLRDGTRFLQVLGDAANKAGLPNLNKRRIWVVSHTEKQRDMLERMFWRFSELYGEIDSFNEYRRVKPEFHVFGGFDQINCNVLVVDEAHDLGAEREAMVREWHNSTEDNYLIIACDRHQKLRLVRDATRMIEGVDFSLCTKKLNRNYRNPFPAYVGGLGLLFRWFADNGPKILPKPRELISEFGFGQVDLESSSSGILAMSSRNDAHPANNWSHVLSSFPSAQATYQQLAEFPLRKSHVLWVRFGPEDADFNYENLQHWSYHSVYGADAPDLLDKYVKGQEFPVVVIEGLPDAFSWSFVSKQNEADPQNAKNQMWQARRMVYLAASRANVFLYFILGKSTPPDVLAEFSSMFSQLGKKPQQDSPAGTIWSLRVKQTHETESFSSYIDALDGPQESASLVENLHGDVSPPSDQLVLESIPANNVEPIPVGRPDSLSAQAASPANTELPKDNKLPASPSPELGAAAPLAEIVRRFKLDEQQVISRLRMQGYSRVHLATVMDVGFVRRIVEPVPIMISPSYKKVSSNIGKGPGDVVAKVAQQSKPLHFGSLALKMRLTKEALTEFLDAGDVTPWQEPGHHVKPEAVDALVYKLVGERGIKAFDVLSKKSITVKELANYLGLRPNNLVRDLMEKKKLLNLQDQVPFDQLVRLCHFYGKQLPDIVGASSDKY